MSAPNIDHAPAAATLPPPRRGFRLKNLLKALAILVLGMFIGSTITVHIGHHLMNKFMGDPAKMGERLHHRLDRELDLTPGQSQKIGVIISNHTNRIVSILREVRPRMTEQFDQLHLEIRKELTTDQAQRWDRIHERMKKHFPPPFGPAPGPDTDN